MNPSSCLALAAALMLAPLYPAMAQSSWETVDDLPAFRGRDVVADASGGFYSLAIDAGNTGVGGVVSTAVSRSLDHGATWQSVGAIAGYALDLAAAPDGALFAAGNRSDTVSGRAFCWQSLDHGVSWTTSDPSVGLPSAMQVLDVSAGNTDAVYVCGSLAGRWMVRKGHRSASGITWSTLDAPALGGATAISVRPGAAGQPDEVVVCGGGWSVRRSVDGGVTWATVGSPSGAYASQNTTGVTFGQDGSLYVVGRTSKTLTTKTVVGKKVVTTTTTEFGLLTRRSGNGGATWMDADYLANGWPLNVTVDAFGRVFVIGFMNTSPNTWLVRGSIDGGASWVSSDPYLNEGTTRAQAMAAASDQFGNVCVLGETGDSPLTYAAPIRRLAAP